MVHHEQRPSQQEQSQQEFHEPLPGQRYRFFFRQIVPVDHVRLLPRSFWGGRNLRGRVTFYLLARNGGLLGYGRRCTAAGGSVVVWSGRPAFPTNGDLRRLQVFQRLKQTLCATGTANSAHHVRDAIITIQDVLQPCSFRLAQRTTRKGRIERGDA